jgi:hypothetical protein
MSVPDRIDHYLSQFDDMTRLEGLLRPREWPPGVIGELPHVQVARKCIRYLHSLAKASERGRMTGEQAARFEEVMRRVRCLWPLADGVAVPARLLAHISESQEGSAGPDH